MTATDHVHPNPNDRMLELIAQMVAETSDGLREGSDPLYLQAIDEGLEALIPIARDMAEEVGSGRARGLLQTRMVREPEKTAGLFAAALLRLGELTEAGRELLAGKQAAVVDGYELVLERRDQADGTAKLGGGAVLLTPMVDDDYWAYRVQVSPTQAIVAFPKFSTIGVGFAVEEDWNTNLPYTVGAERIWEHIEHNKGDESVPDERCLAALRMVVDAVRADRGER